MGEYLVDEIFNEDGTSFNPPENPLKDKWAKLYPPTPMPQYSQVCDGYSCMWCGRCPRGEYWKIPEEDREVYKAYVDEYNQYIIDHNPEIKLIIDHADNKSTEEGE